MSSDDDFQKPRPSKTTAPRNPAANASAAREMVNVHLSGRTPQRQQNSMAIHSRLRAGNEARAGNGESGVAAGNFPNSRPTPGVQTENNGATNPLSNRLDTSPGPANATQSASKSALAQKAGSYSAGEKSAAFGAVSAQKQPVLTPFSSQVSVPATSHIGPCKNPQCAHCGTVIIPSPKASFPYKEQPSITVNDWSIYTTKGPICSSEELDYLNDTRFDFPLPEMIFGSNSVRLVNEKTGAKIEFNTLDALDSLNDTADFKVAYYKEWLSTRPKAKASDKSSISEEILDVSMESSRSVISTTSSASEPCPSPDLQSVKPYDWTYSTNYKGSVENCVFTPTTQDIPLEKLVKQDPILFYDESVLFEDELGDNGIAMLSTKIRVMHSCLLLLCRFSMRVDDVAFRIRDTRIYVDLETNLVMREYKTQQASYEELLAKISGRSTDPKKLLRDSNWVSQNTPVLSREVEMMTSSMGDLS